MNDFMSSNVFFEFGKVKIELPESVFDLVLVYITAELFVQSVNQTCFMTSHQL